MTEYWESISDPRTRDIYLVKGGIWRLLFMIIIYISVTYLIIPMYMKNRRAYKLKTCLLVYNSLMIAINAYLFHQILFSTELSIFLNFQFPNIKDTSFEAMNHIRLAKLFTISRLIDLLDTVFFGLRKKNKQITFLHLYHHSIVPLICWISLKTNPLTPISRMFGLINCFLHIFMYTYYTLANFGDTFQKYFWLKKYLTLAQIIQFVICGLYGVILYCLQTDYPMGWFVVVVGQNPIFFVMFSVFYFQSYAKKRKTL